MNKPAILENAANDRVKLILASFSGLDSAKIIFRNPRLRLWGGQPERLFLDQAASSGRRPGGKLKRLFLLAQFRWCEKFISNHPNHDVIVWNGMKGRRSLLPHAAQLAGHKVYFLEDAPLPGRIAVDRSGINYGSSLPRDISFYKAWNESTEISSDRWRSIRHQIIARPAIENKDVTHETAATELSAEKYIFCPLQVPGDSQITVFGDWIKSVESMIDLISAASAYLPKGWHFRVKEHPSSPFSFREKLQNLESDRFRLDNRTDTMEQIRMSRSVLCVNSSVGLQSFFFDKPVAVLGLAFYAFGGMARRIRSFSELIDFCKDPEAAEFNQDARDAFMNYLDTEYYPTQSAIMDGNYDRNSVAERDERRDEILAKLSLISR